MVGNETRDALYGVSSSTGFYARARNPTTPQQRREHVEHFATILFPFATFLCKSAF